MTPGAVRARTRVLGFALLLAIASGNARGGELYRWETEDGRIEIGTTPPLGAAAVPWSPGQEAAAHPAAPPAPAPAATPRPAPDSAAAALAERRARGRLDEACSREKATTDKATQKIRVLESQIARLERKLEELEATDLAYSRTTCRSQGIEGPGSDCLTSSFHRDAEISRIQQEIEEAQQKLGDLEQRARGVPRGEACAPASAD